jgi:hypothetical protein
MPLSNVLQAMFSDDASAMPLARQEFMKKSGGKAEGVYTDACFWLFYSYRDFSELIRKITDPL